jgi:glutathione S-transferase
MPADRHARANTLTWMFAALNTVEPPIQNLSVMDLQKSEEQWAKLRRPGAVDAVKVRLGALSAWLGGRDYLVDRFTAADVLMTTVLRLIRHTDLVAEFPVLDAYVKRCEAAGLPKGLARSNGGLRSRRSSRSLRRNRRWPSCKR